MTIGEQAMQEALVRLESAYSRFLRTGDCYEVQCIDCPLHVMTGFDCSENEDTIDYRRRLEQLNKEVQE